MHADIPSVDSWPSVTKRNCSHNYQVTRFFVWIWNCPSLYGNNIAEGCLRTGCWEREEGGGKERKCCLRAGQPSRSDRPWAHSASQSTDTQASYPERQAIEACSWPLTPHLQLRLKIPEALPPLPHTSEWRRATNQGPSVCQINSTSSSTRTLTSVLTYCMTGLVKYLPVKVVTAYHLKMDEQPTPETSCVPNITETMDNTQHNISTDLSQWITIINLHKTECNATLFSRKPLQRNRSLVTVVAVHGWTVPVAAVQRSNVKYTTTQIGRRFTCMY